MPYGHPQSEETKKKIGLANSIALRGRKLSQETKLKISKSTKGKILSSITRKKLSVAQKGKHHSPQTEFKRGHQVCTGTEKTRFKKGQNAGVKNHAWRGGITPLNEQIRHSFQYRQWRSDVFTRDNFTCQKCGYSDGRILVAHHIKTFSKIKEEYKIISYNDAMVCEELWNTNNGITLCKNCHILIHKKLKKI